MKYVNEDSRPNVERQLGGFLEKQDELADHVQFYAQERLAFHKELALSLDTYARPTIQSMMKHALNNLNSKDKRLLSERFRDGRLYVDEYVAELATRIKTISSANRAGLATGNERTMKRMTSKIGLDATVQLARSEQIIQNMPLGENEFMVRRSEQIVMESGAGCEGGCSVAIVNPYSKDATLASEAGLSGKLYTADSLDKNSKCGCKKAKVISDGKNVFCVNCTSFQVNGERGNLKKEKKSPQSSRLAFI